MFKKPVSLSIYSSTTHPLQNQWEKKNQNNNGYGFGTAKTSFTLLSSLKAKREKKRSFNWKEQSIYINVFPNHLFIIQSL